LGYALLMPEGIVIRIATLGETQINRRMLRISERATMAAPALELVHDYLTGVSEGQFETQGAASGHPWAPLVSATRERKERDKDPRVKASGSTILVATGALKRSLVNQGDPNMVHIVTNDTMVYGTKLKYGQVHQKPPAGQTRRRPVDLTLENKLVMVKTIQYWIMRGVARLSRGSRFGL
jgi:hypothetical protein